MKALLPIARSLMLLAALLAALCAAPLAHAVVLEGIGHATIHDGDLETAREQARRAALRDVALQYEARISTRDTMENGVLTESRLQVASSARARDDRGRIYQYPHQGGAVAVSHTVWRVHPSRARRGKWRQATGMHSNGRPK